MASKIGQQSIRASELDIDLSLQPRVGPYPDVASRYAEAMKLNGVESFPPIVVWEVDGERKVLDGMNRVQAAMEVAGDPEILCEVWEGTRDEAIEYAAGLNAHHGHPRSMEDIEVAVLHLLRTEKHAKSSNAAIAKLVGISAPTAGKIVKRLVGNGAIDPREDVVDSQGRKVVKKARPVRVKVDGEDTEEIPEAVAELAKKGRIPDGTVVEVTTLRGNDFRADEESGCEGEEFDIDAVIRESECGQLLTGEAADRFEVDAKAFLDPDVQDVLERMKAIDQKMQRFYTQARKKKEGQNKKLPPFLMRWNMVMNIKPFESWKVCDGCEGAAVVFGKGDCDKCKGAGWRP